jgi:8-oxo-dGTP diphosphatase
VVGGRLCATDESRECRYFDPEYLPANTIPRHVERLRDAMNAGEQPIFRQSTAPSLRAALRRPQEGPAA